MRAHPRMHACVYMHVFCSISVHAHLYPLLLLIFMFVYYERANNQTLRLYARSSSKDSSKGANNQTLRLYARVSVCARVCKCVHAHSHVRVRGKKGVGESARARACVCLWGKEGVSLCEYVVVKTVVKTVGVSLCEYVSDFCVEKPCESLSLDGPALSCHLLKHLHAHGYARPHTWISLSFSLIPELQTYPPPRRCEHTRISQNTLFPQPSPLSLSLPRTCT